MKEWLNLQKKLHRRVQTELYESAPHETKALKRYSEVYRRDFKSMAPIDQNSFFRQLSKKELILIGDFHPLSQSQKFLLRLLKHPEVEKPKQIGLEALQPEHNSLIERYLREPKTSLESKLRAILPLDEWGSSWNVYRDIFQECRKFQIGIYGLGSSSSNIKKRDRDAVKEIQKMKKASWILFGEFHCARPHLPSLILKETAFKKIAVVQQNEDRLLQKYLNEFSRRPSVFLKSKNSQKIELFCVLHTPLWVKWQTYIDHQIQREEGDSPVDALEQIRWALRTLSEFLHDLRYPKPLSTEDLLDLSVIEAEDEDFRSALNSVPLAKRKRLYRSLEATRVAALAQDRKVFITEKTLNACAQAAALYLYQTWSDQQAVYRDFYNAALTECICFFLTKILNHSRKTKHWRELKKMNTQTASLALKSQNFIELYSKPSSIINSSKKELIPAGIYVGRILADRLFEAFLAGEFSKQRLNRLLLNAPKTKAETYERLVELQSVGRAFEPSISL